MPIKSTGLAPIKVSAALHRPCSANSTRHSSTTLATGIAIGKRKVVLNTRPLPGLDLFSPRTARASIRLRHSSRGRQVLMNFAVFFAASRKASFASTDL